MVPWLGKPVVLAPAIVELEAVRFAPVVVDAVSKAAALVRMKVVSESLIPPLSFRVVCE